MLIVEFFLDKGMLISLFTFFTDFFPSNMHFFYNQEK